MVYYTVFGDMQMKKLTQIKLNFAMIAIQLLILGYEIYCIYKPSPKTEYELWWASWGFIPVWVLVCLVGLNSWLAIRRKD